jgi:hypothetical protein
MLMIFIRCEREYHEGKETEKLLHTYSNKETDLEVKAEKINYMLNS